MKIKTEIAMDELLALRLALGSLKNVLAQIDPKADKWHFKYDQKHLANATNALDNIVKRS